ncbi:Mitochondrial chaperone Frataxin [Puccinia graminis f. sp. tritici]|uniref:ferroxidase n=1 Tax=Puccinia graminis f. sp. tritici TaxID=56615 RepID=A0A5B0LJG0_PUCGR|nr:Mitochondrial chaperone Frataxin [Puccinia graminis f. sp. tritici]KAA1128441.1 Mitochondrial chaperone Frataxin [Puccinia graminis f. sp. tritici]
MLRSLTYHEPLKIDDWTTDEAMAVVCLEQPETGRRFTEETLAVNNHRLSASSHSDRVPPPLQTAHGQSHEHEILLRGLQPFTIHRLVSSPQIITIIVVSTKELTANHLTTWIRSNAVKKKQIKKRDLDPQEFHQISDQTLDELTEALERLVESDHPEVTGWDVDYSSGVMNFSMGHHGTYVINKQPPNKQIWLSSPFSGPKRFDYDKSRKSWFYSREGNELMALLSSEIDSILGNQFFSQLLHSSSNLPQQ